MTQPQPPITRTTHTLPFDKLSPRDFERLCLWLVERDDYQRAEHLGAAGSEQGRDIVAWREGQLWAFQCKRVRSFGPRDALAEADKVLALPEAERPAGLVFLVTCDVSANTRKLARERCAGEMECHFWAGTELDEKVKRHPDIVEEFFQTTWRDVIQKVTQFLGFGPDVQRAQRNRRAMLQLVKNFWVEGVLEKSLYGAAMIELGMEERADAVEHPWDMVLQTEREDRTLPPGTRIIDVFDEMGGNLLILGEPGSGKTTMLLELARDTIARAEQDAIQPIPVVFNLSSWAGKKQPIAEWLVEELSAKYNIPKKIARPWVENDELLLLLDGLDEVAQEHREDCVRVINGFRQENMVPLAVCSRVADYEALTTRLRLQGAVFLQPLTPQQVDEYLDRVGAELVAVREALQDDATLQELVETPLILSIMSLAYQRMSVGDLRKLDSLEGRRRHVFDAYVRRMFERRKAEQPYSPEQTIHWLAWLAQELSAHRQTIFLIEGLQPDWLTAHARRQVRTISRLVVILLFGLVWGLVGRLLVGGLVVELVVGLVVGLFVGLSIEWDSVKPAETLKWSWREISKWLVSGAVLGLVSGLVFGTVSGLVFERFGGLVAGLVFGLVFGLVGGLIFGLVFGLVGGLILGLFVGLSVGLVGGLGVGLIVGLAVGLGVGLIVGLIFGLSSLDIETKTVPNQGIRQSVKNTLIVGVSSGLVGGLVSGLVIGLVVGPGVGLVVGPGLGLGVGLLVGLSFFGGKSAVLHFILRYVIWRDGHAPWHYARFLDYAAERIFLRRVGGGYIFVHRLLMEYFSALPPRQIQAKKTTDVILDLPRHWKVRILLLAGLVLVIVITCGLAAYRESAAWVHSSRGQRYAHSGDWEQALYELARAAELDPENAPYWNALCWFGSLSGRAADVMYACEQAVELASDHGGIRDSRGLARALTGDYDGAIEDFKFYVEWSKKNAQDERHRSKREAWIAELEAGRNPFDETTLEGLLNE